MFSDLIKDLKYQILIGGFWVKLILLCIFVFILINISNSYYSITQFNSGLNENLILKYLSLSSDWKFNFLHPWVWITHMVTHQGLFHLLWNMLNLFWFGHIVEDLIGKKHAITIVFGAGVLGGVFFIISCMLLPWYMGQEVMAYGASAFVMGLILAAATIAPNYSIRLILLGTIPIKFIALFLIVLDVLLAVQMNNSGGHAAHLGGAFFGYVYILSLRSGISISPVDWLPNFTGIFKDKSSSNIISVSQKITVESKKDEVVLNRILEKIKKNGIESLSIEEKNYLDQLAEK